MKKILFALLVLSPFLHADDQSQIMNLLRQWPRDFNNKNVEAVCQLFAPDLIASYPGTKDRNYGEMCRQLKEALNLNLQYDAPNIEQIVVDGDLAIVRLIWTLHTNESTIKEKGLDVFKWQPDGTWKIMISYAYPFL